MYTNRVRILNFRNHIDSLYDFENINYIEGDNGTGKTSVLESLFVLFNLKSFRQQTVKKAIRFKQDFFLVSAKCLDGDFQRTFHYRYETSAELKDDEGKVSGKAEYLSMHPVICYSPEYGQVVSDDQDDRRRFIDRLSFQIDRGHFDRLTDLRKLNLMKVSELKKDRLNRAYIDSVNEKIVELSEKISGTRECTAGQINDHMRQTYAELGFDDGFRLDFRSNVKDKNLLLKEIVDRRLLYGSSRDRFYSVSDGRVYDRFSSFGQKKTFVLITLASGLKLLEKNGKNGIITLLDDFEAGLDKSRIERLFHLFDTSAQIFITGVKNTNFSSNHTIRIQVKDGS
ncbi:Recombinational DNA repair ATPase (RecF pathway)- like protein [Denitrovibrio acetiphilus DSM 12809]|uniref:DNA replication and repair protein RecF n=1 Tax=Denitrovibrio acetiphilus (strain DSM 12809 / NBRC 114555 / N2460) TaxID=522772 RepID=D4H6E6_DENA2|nr:AAA family ATPase [Denitrovibrio acetiphilus]ADD69620.1 Recombinational DNA repair ATPase (RecF pathway)- like protein [Denitrovibrio acetiphilus DSM 12809]